MQKPVTIVIICFLSLYITQNLVKAQSLNSSLIDSSIRQLGGDWRQQSEGIFNLSNIGKPAIPALIQASKSENTRLSSTAAIVIAKIGNTNSKLALAIFTDALQNKNYEVRIAAIIGFGYMHEKAPTVPILIQTLQDSKPIVRSSAVTALSNAVIALNNINEISQILVPALVKTLQQDSDHNVRYNIVNSLGVLGKNSPLAINALTIALQDKNNLVRSSAAQSLGKIGSRATAAIPALFRVLKDKNPRVRGNAIVTLGIIDKSNPSIKYIARSMLNDEQSFVRIQAASTLLVYLRTETKTAFTTIIEDLQGKDYNEKQYAAFILYEIAAEYKRIAPDLSQIELEQSIYYFNTSLLILHNPVHDFPTEIITSVRDTITVLYKERVKRQFKSFIIQGYGSLEKKFRFIT